MKRNLVISFLIGLLFTFTGNGCNLGANEHNRFQDIKKETRDVEKFKSIGLSTSAELILVQGSPQKLELEGDADDLQKIVTKVDGSSLEIKQKHGTFRMGKVKIYITVEDIESLAVSGSGSISAADLIHSEHLALAVSGSGKIQLTNLKASSISSAVSGSGAIRLGGKNGKVKDHDIAISGSGDVFAEDIETAVVKIGISGSGTCKVFATEKLDAGVSGSGTVYYKGGAVVDAGISGSGKVRTME
jgi:hypothetical protein